MKITYKYVTTEEIPWDGEPPVVDPDVPGVGYLVNDADPGDDWVLRAIDPAGLEYYALCESGDCVLYSNVINYHYNQYICIAVNDNTNNNDERLYYIPKLLLYN